MNGLSEAAKVAIEKWIKSPYWKILPAYDYAAERKLWGDRPAVIVMDDPVPEMPVSGEERARVVEWFTKPMEKPKIDYLAAARDLSGGWL